MSWCDEWLEPKQIDLFTKAVAKTGVKKGENNMKTLEELGYVRIIDKKDKTLYRKNLLETSYIKIWKEIEIFKATGKKYVGKSEVEEDKKTRNVRIEALNFTQEEIEAIAQIMRGEL